MRQYSPVLHILSCLLMCISARFQLIYFLFLTFLDAQRRWNKGNIEVFEEISILLL